MPPRNDRWLFFTCVLPCRLLKDLREDARLTLERMRTTPERGLDSLAAVIKHSSNKEGTVQDPPGPPHEGGGK